MPRPFKKKSFLDKVEDQLSDLAAQTDDLRKQLVDRAPAVRDQIVEQTGELRKQVSDRAPVVRDQIVSALPDKAQLLDLRDDLFDKLPDNVQDKLPEKVKPKRSKLRKVAAVGVVTGAGAAAFAILKRKGATQQAYVAPTPPPAPTHAPVPTVGGDTATAATTTPGATPKA